MNRLDQRLITARVTLNSALVADDTSPELVRRRLTPVMQQCVGILGFFFCGSAIVAVAGLLALQIH